MNKGMIAILVGGAAWGISRMKLADKAAAVSIIPGQPTATQIQQAVNTLEAQAKQAAAMVADQNLSLLGQVRAFEQPYLDFQVNYKDLGIDVEPETASLVKTADAVKAHNILEASGYPAIGSSILAGAQDYADAQGISYVEALERTTGIETTPELRQELANAGIITQAEVMAEPAEAPAGTGYGGFASPEDFEAHYGYSYFEGLEEPVDVLYPQPVTALATVVDESPLEAELTVILATEATIFEEPAPDLGLAPARPSYADPSSPDYNPYIPYYPPSVVEGQAEDPIYGGLYEISEGYYSLSEDTPTFEEAPSYWEPF